VALNEGRSSVSEEHDERPGVRKHQPVTVTLISKSWTVRNRSN